MERKIYTFESFLIEKCGKGEKPECKDDEKCGECGKKECTCGDEEDEKDKD